MTDARYWSKEFMIDFIELYKSYPCLWKVNSKEYTNKMLKKKAFDKMVELCKQVHQNPDKDFVVRKIQSIRGSFRKEVKKVEASMKKATCPEDVYQSSLWYYDYLLFTKDQEYPTVSAAATNMNEETDSIDCEEENDEQIENWMKFEPETSDVDSRPEVIHTKSRDQGIKRRYEKIAERPKVSEEAQQLIEMCKSAFNATSNNALNISESDAVGINVTKKLKRMDARQALLAENLISTVLLKGLLNKLTEETSLCNVNCNTRTIIAAPQPSGHCSQYTVKYEDVPKTTSTNLLGNSQIELEL